MNSTGTGGFSGKHLALLAAALLILVVLALVASLAGCGNKSAEGPPESEVGAPVYPGADFLETGLAPGSYKYSSKDSSAQIVNWYREELADADNFEETSGAAEAITGNMISYTDGENKVFITILPGMEGEPTTLDIYVNRPVVLE